MITAALLIAIMAVGYCGTRILPDSLSRNKTVVTHDVVVSQLRAVAKLVSTEAVVRDVVVYENTWYGSTKRSLVVVSGKLLAGIDLGDNPNVSIDHAAKKISIRLPPAKLIAVEITDMRTYDERGGLWNPFRPEDRDAIQKQARAQLAELVVRQSCSATLMQAPLSFFSCCSAVTATRSRLQPEERRQHPFVD